MTKVSNQSSRGLRKRKERGFYGDKNELGRNWNNVKIKITVKKYE